MPDGDRSATVSSEVAAVVNNLPAAARDTVNEIGDFFSGLGEFPAWKIGVAALFPIIAIGLADGALQMASFLGISLLAGMALLFGGEANAASAPVVQQSRRA